MCAVFHTPADYSSPAKAKGQVINTRDYPQILKSPKIRLMVERTKWAFFEDTNTSYFTNTWQPDMAGAVPKSQLA